MDQISIRAEFAELWREMIFPNLMEALEKTPDDKLDWAPAENMISLGNLFLHIAECSDWWYGEVMLGQDSVELAFPDKPCVPKSQILVHMKEHEERMNRLLDETDEVLGQTYKFGRSDDPKNAPGTWIYAHMIEHDIHHRSQINQYLRILGIEPPQI
jgi:uncharacterized damage-inducible protein DinB